MGTIATARLTIVTPCCAALGTSDRIYVFQNSSRSFPIKTNASILSRPQGIPGDFVRTLGCPGDLFESLHFDYPPRYWRALIIRKTYRKCSEKLFRTLSTHIAQRHSMQTNHTKATNDSRAQKPTCPYVLVALQSPYVHA